MLEVRPRDADGRVFMRGRDGLYCYDLRVASTVPDMPAAQLPSDVTGISGPSSSRNAPAEEHLVLNANMRRISVSLFHPGEGDIDIRVFNASGRMVTRSVVTAVIGGKHTFSVPGVLSTGTYLVRVSTQRTVQTQIVLVK